MSGAPAQTEQPVQSPPAAAQNTDSGQQQEQTIPYARFKEVNDALTELKRKDQERETKERAESEKRAKERGEWERIATERESEINALKPQVETATARQKALEETMAAQIKDRIKALSPDAQKVFARLGDDVLVQFAALPEIEAIAAAATPRSPGTPAGPRGTGASTVVIATPAAKQVGDGF